MCNTLALGLSIFASSLTTKTKQMKNVFYTAAVAVIIMMSSSSCRKCQICTKDSAPEVRVCESDYNNVTEFGVVIDVLEGSGYNCR